MKKKRIYAARQKTSVLVAGLIIVALLALLGGCGTSTSNPGSASTVTPGLTSPGNNSNTAPGVTQSNPEECEVPPVTYTTAPYVKAETRSGVQYVTTTLHTTSYDPISVQMGVPVVWTMTVPNGSMNTCNNTVVVPQYNLKVVLHEGENTIQFTPSASGTYVFGCWMGMIRSSIEVVGADGVALNNSDDAGADALDKLLTEDCC